MLVFKFGKDDGNDEDGDEDVTGMVLRFDGTMFLPNSSRVDLSHYHSFITIALSCAHCVCVKQPLITKKK